MSFDTRDERHVDLYDELTLWSSFAGQLLLEHVPLNARSVLDLGCGAGFPLMELAERLGPTAHVVGLDPWRLALGRAGRKRDTWPVRNAGLVCGSGAAMPFRSDAFDLIVSNLGVNNFDDKDSVLAECRRVTKSGGVIAVTSNLVGHMREMYEVFAQVLANDAPALERLQRDIAHRATVKSLREMLERAGFRIVAVHEREVLLRFASAGALLEHHFVRLGFRAGWEEVAGTPTMFARFREALGRQGELRLTIPFAYVEGRAS